MSDQLKLSTFDIANLEIRIDREAAYDILTALSELHGRLCNRIADCGDMDESTVLGGKLANIGFAYNRVESFCARFDDREPKHLDFPNQK